MQPAISLIDVTKRYGDAPPALAHASVSVGKREFLAVVGGSGSGKTKLLRLINPLSEPSEGGGGFRRRRSAPVRRP
jgi:ABC-type Fe3+/spermidine/putrescine transport system ATPase subunit